MAEPAEPEPEPEPRQAPPPREAPPQHGDAMAAFWEAAGLDPRVAADACGPDKAGAMFGALVRGLWEVLRARTAFKEEFRVERTMLGAANNNPVKFAIDPEQALEGLARPAARGFMAPLDAVEESFDDIRRHELAMMAAMHRALSHVLEEFDPETLESKLEGMSFLDALPGGRRARYWDLYVKHYAEIARKAEDIFEGALGREFVAAYEKASHGNRGGEE
jgi:type VI secretion system FHA domain protein